MRLRIITLPFLLLVVYAANGQKVGLILLKGQKVEISSFNKVTSSTEVMGQTLENNIESTIVQLAEVKDTRAGETDIELVNSKITANVQMMGQDINYDSDKKEESGPMAESFSKYFNKFINFTIGTDGHVIRKDSIKEEAAGNPGISVLDDKFTELGFINLALLGRDITVDATWIDTSIKTEAKTTVNNAGVYKVVSIENNVATITYDGTSASEGMIEQMGQEMKLTTQNKISGTIKLDILNGIVLSEATDITLHSTISAAGMEILSTGKGVNTMTAKVL